jgi:multiple sugar transport system substrate-binding protein
MTMPGLLIKLVCTIAIAVLIGLTLQIDGPVRADNRIKVRWFVGFGAGTAQAEYDAQKAVVDQFNASQSEISLELQVATGGSGMILDAFSVMVGADDAPDIVGPIDVADAAMLPSEWANLAPLVLKDDYDLSQIPDELIKFYTGPDGLQGIPFGLYPPVLFYRPQLFAESDLGYPPTKIGDLYILDGKAVAWDYDTFNEVAKRLTYDVYGNDATNPSFNREHIEQFGLAHEWDAVRFDFTSGSVVELIDQVGRLRIPAAWWHEAHGIWTSANQFTSPNGTYLASAMLIPNPFASGRVAMERNNLSYACCLSDTHPSWDIAVPPMYLGETRLPINTLTFRIPTTSKHSLSAFKVIQYLAGPAALDLLTTYGMYPARIDLRNPFVQVMSAKYPKVKGWAALDQGSEPIYSDFNAGKVDMGVFYNLLYLDRGQQMNVDAELDKLAAGQVAATATP